jgi:lipopolysaccharide transport system ATP-binding protein
MNKKKDTYINKIPAFAGNSTDEIPAFAGSDILVEVEGLSKKFCKDLKTSLWYGVKDLMSNISGNHNDGKLRPQEFWAVKDINFTLRRGECLGLIGHNGAGKSTLLKILNGLINPDEGKVTIRGKVGALIELGAGFNPILSGRENIYNNGAVLGFTKAEIDAKVEEIIDFSEIREFIDMPVQNYSSGMKVRLGFAVAAELEPDILIIDEVLAVGDIGFRTKCLNRIGKLLPTCTTIFVSHGMPQVARVASRIVLLDHGSMIIDTNTISEGIEKYYSTFHNGIENNIITGNKEIDLLEFYINDIKAGDLISVPFNSKIKFKAILTVKNTVKSYFISYAFIDVDTKIVANLFSSIEDIIFEKKGVIEIETVIDRFNLGAGNFTVSISINEILSSGNRGSIYYHNTDIARITIINVITAIAPVQFTGEWKEIILEP